MTSRQWGFYRKEQSVDVWTLQAPISVGELTPTLILPGLLKAFTKCLLPVVLELCKSVAHIHILRHNY